MSFLNPVFIWFIPLVFIPLVIHLLNFRRPEQLAFSSIAFLEELQKTVVRNLKLKEWVLLAIRTLLAAFLLLALAQPFISENGVGASGQETIHLVIENGIGMDRVDENGPLLEQAKQWAISLIAKAPETQMFIVNTLSSTVISNRVVGKADAIAAVEKISQSYSNSSWQNLFASLHEDPIGKIIYLSDVHPSKLNHSLADTLGTSLTLSWIPVGKPNQLNLYVESVDLENQVLVKNKPVQIRVVIAASGIEGAINGSASLWLNDEVAGEYQLGLAAGEKQQFVFNFTPKETGFLEAKIKLVGDAYLADNERFFVLAIPDYKQIAVITDRTHSDEELIYMRALFDAANANDSELKFDIVELNALSGINAESYASFLFLGLKEFPDFLKSLTQQWINESKGLMIIPSVQSNLQNYNQFFASTGISAKYSGIKGSFSSPEVVTTAKIADAKHQIFQQVFDGKTNKSIEYEKPNVFAYYQIEKTNMGLQMPVINSVLNEPLLVETKVQQAKVIVSAIGTGSAWSNFPSNALFAPLWYRLAWYVSMSETGGLHQTELGKVFTQKVNKESKQIVITHEQMGFNEQPVTQRRGSAFFVSTLTHGMESGIITIKEDNMISQKMALYLSPDLSAFRDAKNDEIELIFSKQFKHVSVYDVNSDENQNALVDLTEHGTKLWPIVAVLAFLLLIAESAVSIWFKAETSG
ncbi:hypothetical protein EP331_01920 [bacterium]|nr:MAG: hypothetical protein EP331_01920 [bacterium]